MDDSDMDEGITNIDERRGGTLPDRDGDVVRKRTPENRRTRVRDPGSQIRRLECFSMVDQMVREGKYLREIVSYIRDERQELTELSRRAITYLVKNYRESLYSDDVAPDGIVDPDRPDHDDPMYGLLSQERFYRILEERIEMEVATERSLTKLFSTTHKEFAQLQTMWKGIHKAKKEMGLIGGERGGVRQRVGSGLPGRLDIPEVISSPESRQKILGLVEALVSDPELLEDLGSRGSRETKKSKTSRPKRRKKRNRE